MKEPSKLLVMMFEHDRWQNLLDNATEKEIDLKTIKELCYPEERKKLFQIIYEDKYNIFPPSIIKIPKDNPGEFREVYVNIPRDRIVLSLINDCLCDLFKNMIHPKCRSYQKGLSSQTTVKDISNELAKLSEIIDGKLGYKIDFSKYFPSVSIKAIDNVFDKIEERLGFERNSEPVINLLRRYYHQDLYFDVEGNLQSRYQGLKEGCSVASFLANVVLYELDEFLANKYSCSYRYSDDLVVVDKDTSSVIDDINNIIDKYGVKLNPKKVEPLYADKFFKFLGFNIKGSMISLSKTRLKKFQAEIERRTIDRVNKKQNVTKDSARKSVLNYLYGGEYNFATACLGVINVSHDLEEMDNFIKDCIRSCEVWENEKKQKTKVGGLGCAINLEDKTVLRGKGKHVKYLREHTGKYIENYLTLKCLSNNMKISKTVFEATVRNMKG